MQLVERQEILLLQENVVKCQLYMSGIISLCNQLETFNWELKRKVLLPSLSVHAKDMLLLSIKAMIILCISIMFREKKCFFNLLLEMMPFLIFNGLKNQMILDLLLFLLELFNFGIQLMQAKNYLKMVLSEQSSNKLNSPVLFSMKMVSAIQEEQTEEFTFGIKNKILALYWKLMLEKLLLLHANKDYLFQLEKMICFLFFHVIKENINSLDKLLLNSSTLLHHLTF